MMSQFGPRFLIIDKMLLIDHENSQCLYVKFFLGQ